MSIPTIAPTIGTLSATGIATVRVPASTIEGGVTSFDYEYDGIVTSGLTSPADFTVISLSANHRWRARARNASGVGPWSGYQALGGPGETVLAQATLVAGSFPPSGSNLARLAVSQGDTATFQLIAQDGFGFPVDLNGAMFSTKILASSGAGEVVFSDALHEITDAINGSFTLNLSPSDTATLALGSNHQVVTLITIGASVVLYRSGNILTVFSPSPVQ